MGRDIQLPAPGRGAYDRSLTRTERDAQHRDRLFLAAAAISEQGDITVARIVAHAGVGRSTFYEFFDSPEHLLAQLEQRVARAVESALQSALAEARTPLERVRAIARRFLAALEAQPVEARFALAHRLGRPNLSPAAAPVHRALEHVIEASRRDAVGWFRATDSSTVLAAAAIAEALARRHLGEGPIRDAPRVLADLLIKVLR
jgi:AcrR family transcriptional regulator